MTKTELKQKQFAVKCTLTLTFVRDDDGRQWQHSVHVTDARKGFMGVMNRNKKKKKQKRKRTTTYTAAEGHLCCQVKVCTTRSVCHGKDTRRRMTIHRDTHILLIIIFILTWTVCLQLV